MSSWSKQPVVASNAPKAIGPYSVAVKAGPFLFVSGQLGLDPATGDLVTGGVAAETRQALSNLKAILEAAGCGLDAVVKTTVFLRDMGEFSTMNQVYNEFFS
ncbi:MAG: Rid family detoxifying hydrolase, partial [Thermanaerothrix sp.]|uniref:Rid family detoxifying hydrolase n=1 Tax=Thermanaerothrix sp. TaxID=2972675 RepID=UPI003C7D8E93